MRPLLDDRAFAELRTPRLVFGNDCLAELGGLARAFGKRCLLVTGAQSLAGAGRLAAVHDTLAAAGVTATAIPLGHEPTPSWVDEVVTAYRSNVDCVIAIGGGSVVDAGKAVAAMLCEPEPVTAYLEGVGTRTPSGERVPFIAVPTTAGTGSEATKNAVLSQQPAAATAGFKKSLRHDNYVPDIALIDPTLAVACPTSITAACGMDAFTQLLESFVSTAATPATDEIALDGLQRVATHLIPACTDRGADTDVRGELAYAAYLSGVTLAHAGLGVVHGIAGPLGGLFPIPHGVACGTLLAEATRRTIAQLRTEPGRRDAGLDKYSTVGALVAATPADSDDDDSDACDRLIARLDQWTAALQLPRLGDYGMLPAHIDTVVALSSNKNNPVPLPTDDLRELLVSRL